MNKKNKWILFAGLLMLVNFKPMNAQEAPEGKVLEYTSLSEVKGFEAFDSARLSNAGYFFAGGVTGKNFPHFNAALFSYLNQKQGVNHILINLGYSETYMLNKLLDKDDSAYVNRIGYFFPEKKDWVYVCRFLKATQTAENKVTLKGYNLSRNLYASIELLYELMEAKEIPDNLRIPVESIIGLAKYNWLKLSEKKDYALGSYGGGDALDNSESRNITISYFLSSFDSLNQEYKTWLGNEKYEIVKEVVKEIKDFRRIIQTESTPFTVLENQERKFRNIELHLKDKSKKWLIVTDLCNSAYEPVEGLCSFVSRGSLAGSLIKRGIISKDKAISIGFYEKENSLYNYSKSSKNKSKEEEKYGNELDEVEIRYDEGVYLFSTTDNHIPLMSKVFDYMVMVYDYTPVYIDSLKPVGENSDSSWNNLYSPGRKKTYGNVGYYYQQVRYFPAKNSFENSLRSIGYSVPKGMFTNQGALLSVNAERSKFMMDYTVTNGYFANKPELLMYSDTGFNSYWKSWSINEYLGGNIINHKNIILSAGGQLGYYSNRIRQYPVYSNNTFFPTDYKQPTTYRNNAITFGPFSSLQLNFAKIFSVGIMGGYMIDLSRKGWLLNGKYTGDRTELSYNMFYYAAQAGLVVPIH